MYIISLTSLFCSQRYFIRVLGRGRVRKQRRCHIASQLPMHHHHSTAQSELGHRSSPILSHSAVQSDIGHGLLSGIHSWLPPSTPNAHSSPKPVVSSSRSHNSSIYSLTRTSVLTPVFAPKTATKSLPVASKFMGPFSSFHINSCSDSVISIKVDATTTMFTLEGLYIFCIVLL